MRFGKIISVILTVSLLLSLPMSVSAEGEATLEASIEAAYGGAKGIITPTFDDGDYDTAVALKTLCDKYDLSATVMLIPGRIVDNPTAASQTTQEQWMSIFADGRIEPQSHSMTHSGALGSKNDPTVATIESEILGSAERLRELFPNCDILCYAPQGGADTYNCLTDSARELAMSEYYMIRGAGNSGLQSISPSFTLGAEGSWSYILAPSVDSKSIDELKQWVDDTVKNGKWYCAYGHKIAAEAGTRISSYETMEAWFAYMAEARDRGDVWVTTLSSAIKYVRERQSSTVNAKYDGNKITVSVEMADTTEDGLALSADVFDHPLTVKIAVPSHIKTVRYTLGGECYTADTFKEDNVRYLRVDILPDSTLTLTNLGDAETPHDLESVKSTQPTCLGGGTVAHFVCKDCRKIFDKSGAPLDKIETDDIGAHKLVDVPRVEATETSEGNIAHKHCSVCEKNFNANEEELSDVSIPKLVAEDNDSGDGAILIIIGAVAAVAVIAGAVIIFAKKKKS